MPIWPRPKRQGRELLLEQLVERNHQDIEDRVLRLMADAVSIAAVKAVEPTIKLERTASPGKDWTPTAMGILACVLSLAMARRLCYAFDHSASAEREQWYRDLATALLRTFNSLSEERLAEEKFLFLQWCFDRAERMNFGLEPYLTHAFLTRLLTGKSGSGLAQLKRPFSGVEEAIDLGYELGDPKFAVILLDAESRLFDAWRELQSL